MPDTTDQILDTLRTEVGKAVAEKVEESMRKATEAPPWIASLLAAQAKATVPAEKNPPHFGAFLRLTAKSGFNQGHAIDLARKEYEGPAAESIVKSLTTSTWSAGGSLVPTTDASELFEYLRPAAVVRRLGTTVLPMPNGNLNIGGMTSGATATYYGETANALASQGATGSVSLSAKKLITIVPISKDFLRFANPQADALIQRDAIAAMAAKEDVSFIRSDGTTATPKGLKYWCPSANAETVNATVNLANVTTDLGLLINDLLGADCKMIRPAWIFAPRTWIYLVTVRDGNGNFAFRNEMLSGPMVNGVPSGTLWGYPYGVTTQIPINLNVSHATSSESELYFFDAGDAVIGDALQMSVEMADGAAYYDAAGTLTGGFSRDEAVLKIVSEHDFGLRHAASVAYFTDVDWGA